jgi:hypothetical protein
MFLVEKVHLSLKTKLEIQEKGEVHLTLKTKLEIQEKGKVHFSQAFLSNEL